MLATIPAARNVVAFTSWTEGGRESLTVYGPDGTDRLVDALYGVYAEDIEYRQDIYPTDGISNIETELVSDNFSVRWTAGRSTHF